MAELLIVLYLAYVTAVGWVWYRFLARPLFWRWTHLAWSFGLGSILWPYTLLLINLLKLPSQEGYLWAWALGLLIVPLIGDMAARRPLQAIMANSPVRPLRWAKPLVLVLLSIAALTAALQALAFPMHMWDSIVIYGFKAKILFQEQTFRTKAFLDPSVLHFSADYPLLIPYLEAGYYRWLGHTDDRVVRLLFLAYWAAWLGILYDALAARIRRDFAGLIISVVATLPLFSNIYMGQAVSGFADIPLAFYWTAFLLSGFEMWRHGREAPWGVTVLFALGCVLTKSEGLVAVLMSGSLLVWAAPPQSRRSWLFPAVFAIVLFLPWAWAWKLFPHNSAHYPRNVNVGVVEFMRRTKLIGSSFLYELIQIRSWSLFWPLILLGFLWPVRRLPFPKEAKVCLAAAALQLGAYGYVYLTYRQNLELLIPVTMLRLLIHTVGPLTLAVGWRLQD